MYRCWRHHLHKLTWSHSISVLGCTKVKVLGWILWCTCNLHSVYSKVIFPHCFLCCYSSSRKAVITCFLNLYQYLFDNSFTEIFINKIIVFFHRVEVLGSMFMLFWIKFSILTSVFSIKNSFLDRHMKSWLRAWTNWLLQAFLQSLFFSSCCMISTC